jgi:beta-1,4-mannosyl-glycoprotein beta-1,4-N-acetylglucosaminyltransferase
MVIDSFPFNGEAIVELRLQILSPYVQRFYVIEARMTHAGQPKDALFSESPKWREIFGRYGDRISVVIVDEFPPAPLVSVSGYLRCYVASP